MSGLPGLCSACALIFNSEDIVLYKRPKSTSLFKDGFSEEDEGNRRSAIKPHHDNVRDMAQSALIGCYICNFVWRHFFPEKTPQAYMEVPAFLRTNRQGHTCPHVFMNSGTHYRLCTPDPDLEVAYSDDTIELEIGLDSPMRGAFAADDHISEHKRFTFSPLAAEDEQREGHNIDVEHVHVYPPSADIYDKTTWKTIQTWISRCSKNHKECISGRDPSWFPTRLLALDADPDFDGTEPGAFVADMLLSLPGHGRRVKLIETAVDKPAGPFMTLTHRWGKKPSLKTTRDNISAMKRRINLDELSPVFSQAVEFARTLGIRYLWIDSLCIIQKDDDDWMRECGQLGRIYSNSFLTLSATAGGGSLLQPRRPELIFPMLVYPRWRHRSPQIYVLTDFRFWDERIYRSPTNSRCWITQERWLSPRVLHFASDQLVWECRQLEACETFPGCLPRETRTNKHTGFKRRREDIESDYDQLYKKGDDDSVVPNTPTSLVHREWITVVETYARTEATKLRDRVAGIFILAESFGQRLDDTFLAGCWRKTLVSDLLWWVDKTQRSNWLSNNMHGEATYGDWWDKTLNWWDKALISPPPRPVTESMRIKHYIAPSWSWLSVLGDVEFFHGLRPGLDEAMVNVLDVSIQYIDPDRHFSGIRSASLEIQGRLYPIEVKRGNRDWKPHKLLIAGVDRQLWHNALDYSIMPHLDQPESYEDVENCCFLPLVKRQVSAQFKNMQFEMVAKQCGSETPWTENSDWDFEGLFLKPTSGQGKYQRLGKIMLEDTKKLKLFESGFRTWKEMGFDSLEDDHMLSLDAKLYRPGAIGTLTLV